MKRYIVEVHIEDKIITYPERNKLLAQARVISLMMKFPSLQWDWSVKNDDRDIVKEVYITGKL